MTDENTEGLKLYDDARRFDNIVQNNEDWANVEELYWSAFNILIGSPDAEHQRICAGILERIAHRLKSEGKEDSARDLLVRATIIKEKVNNR